MDTSDAMRAAEAIGSQATDMIQALDGIKPPESGNPLSGVARSALTRCRQIAEQMSYLSAEAAGQMRTFENSERRGRELAETRLAAKRRHADTSVPTASRRATTPAMDDGEEEDLWDDEL